jgi:hypothetical protein
MKKDLNRIIVLAEDFCKKAQQVSPDANVQFALKNAFVELINNEFNSIKRPDKVILSLIALSDANSFSLKFIFGTKAITAINSDTAANIEQAFNKKIEAYPKLKILFDKKFFGPFQMEIAGNEFKLVEQTRNNTNRIIRTDL